MKLNVQEIDHVVSGVITTLKKKGVANIQEICRSINNRDFKWCHKKHDKYQHIDDRIDNQFVKQCNDCSYHYRDVYSIVRKMEKEGKIKTELRRFYDRMNDENKYYPKKKDLFRFCWLDDLVYHKMILRNTLDGYP